MRLATGCTLTQIFIAPVLTFVYLIAQEVFQGGALKDAVVEVQSKGFQMLLADWCFWPLADFLNFRFSSVHVRFVVMNLQDVAWSHVVVKHCLEQLAHMCQSSDSPIAVSNAQFPTKCHSKVCYDMKDTDIVCRSGQIFSFSGIFLLQCSNP